MNNCLKKKVEYIQQFLSTIDVFRDAEDIKKIPNNPEWKEYFDNCFCFDYINMTFINYGFLLSDEAKYDYLGKGLFKYENDVPKNI